DETDRMLATLLAQLAPPMPVALGVLYRAPEGATYERAVHDQVSLAMGGARPGPIRGDLDALLRSGRTWEVG
ncbi:MAG TPA: 2-oxoacid:ferredoxin oxidoreductase subunit beta, partial [Arenibaculum sp.]|nr:2-oxoacid:ferredoxin oxidoreductase subunit beta [Arenibaculum sp.]